jgi:hypothetical protein
LNFYTTVHTPGEASTTPCACSERSRSITLGASSSGWHVTFHRILCHPPVR